MEDNYQLAKWLNGELTPEELAAFESQPDYHLYKKIRDYSAELTTADFDTRPMLAKILAAKKAPSPDKHPKTLTLSGSWWTRIAAVLVLGLGMYFAYNAFSLRREVAQNGQQASFLLPDNSQVTLNSGSEASYKKWNWGSHRNLDLTGEAYFSVAKGKKFRVITPLGTVTVLGTQFNVRARNNRFDVTCYEGRVAVSYKNRQMTIGQGQTIAFADGKKMIDQKTNLLKPAWTAGQMVFEKAQLTDVLEEIERRHNIRILLKNLNSTQLFSGSIPDNNIEIALQAVAATYHLKVSRVSDGGYALEPTK